MAENPVKLMQLHCSAPLAFKSMDGEEELGKPFEYRVVGLAKQRIADLDGMLATPASVSVMLPDDTLRHFHGVVCSVGYEGQVGKLFAYRLVLRPWLWLLTRRADLRIFQNKSVPDILRAVLGAFSGDYRKEIEVARRAEALHKNGEPESFELAWLQGIGGVLAGDLVEGFSWIRKAATLAEEFQDPRGLSAAGEVAIYLCDAPLAQKFLTRTVAAFRASGAVASLPYALALLSTVEVSLGRLTSAAANAAEGVRLARDTGQQLGVSMGLAGLELHRPLV